MYVQEVERAWQAAGQYSERLRDGCSPPDKVHLPSRRRHADTDVLIPCLWPWYQLLNARIQVTINTRTSVAIAKLRAMNTTDAEIVNYAPLLSLNQPTTV